jgi:hypothetical protein
VKQFGTNLYCASAIFLAENDKLMAIKQQCGNLSKVGRKNMNGFQHGSFNKKKIVMFVFMKF